MRTWTAIAVLAVAIGALLHFWPDSESRIPRDGANVASAGDPPMATTSNPVPQSRTSPASLPASGERAAAGTSAERSAAPPVQVIIHAPPAAQLGETVPVTIEVRATEGIRQLEFSVTYSKQILELVESSPGAFARPGGPSALIEEVSEGSFLVRVGSEGGVLAGVGSVAVVQFRALRRGVSSLEVDTVRYVVDGRQNESSDPVAYEGTITVE